MRLLYSIPDRRLAVPYGGWFPDVGHELSSVMGYRGHRVTVIARQSPESSRGATRPSAASRLQWGLRALAAGLISSAGVHHAFGAVDAAGLAVAAALRHQPLVISLDVVDRQRWEATARTAHRLLLEAMDRAAAIVVASEYAAARLRQEYDRDAEVLVPGVFCDAFRMPRRLDSTRAIVSPAHPVAGRAGICVLLEAFGHLASEMPDVKLHLFGAPPSSWLVKQLDRLDAVVATRIHLGGDAAEARRNLYATAAVGALPYPDEASGRPLVEYLAAGLPAVAPSGGVGHEILTEDTGVCTAGGVQSWTMSLRRALELAADAHTAERCRARAAEFDWSRRADSFEALYRRLAA